MTTYNVYTVENGRVERGATVEALVVKGAGIEIPAIIIGEEGRGRERGVLPVDGVTLAPGTPNPKVMAAALGTTRTGKPKLLAAEKSTMTEKTLVVFRTTPGFRGGCSHLGDRLGWHCRCGATGTDSPASCPAATPETAWEHEVIWDFAPFPGEVICQGHIAQGTAGRAGGGPQVIALVPAGVVFRVGRTGRLYGAPGAHYGRWDGENLVVMTRTERDAVDIF